MTNSYLKRRQQGGSGKTGRRAEERTAGRVGGRQTPGSGSLNAKGDIATAEVLIENKATEKDSLQISRHWLSKIGDEARMEGKQPALAFQFTDSTGRPLVDGSWVAIPEALYRRLIRQGGDDGS